MIGSMEGGAPVRRTLAERLEDARKELGLTQEELAARSGVPVRTYNAIVTGHTKKPQQTTLRLLYAALGLDDSEEATMEDDPDEGAVCPKCERVRWAYDIELYNDMMGLFLSTMPIAERRAVMNEATRTMHAYRK